MLMIPLGPIYPAVGAVVDLNNEAVENFKAYIASQVLAENVTLIDKAEDGAQPIEIDDIQTFIKIQKM